MHHDKKSLLKRILDRRCRIQDLSETLFDELRHFKRMVYGTGNVNRNGTQAPASLRVGQQIIREQGMQIENGIRVESYLVC